ncbi:MAG: hypothetical protein KF760_23365 [Candidatus Eremiobacteraeota bacterium]|nr:hypothetical protein [Candidatus Eremiobacteraeota bacterium]MCW5866164.1 hypothetical protein [Candidatus Eremiobacteraeota bacterium]
MSEQKQSTYQTVAETVGMIPSLNKNDNLYQGIFVLVVSLASFAVGCGLGGSQVGLVFLLLGLIGSGLLSGLVLMILGFVRLGRKKT